VVTGLGLAVGAVFGRAYFLVLVGLCLVATVQVASWVDIELGGEFGDPTFSPDSVAQLEDEYRLVAGQLNLDFGSLDPTDTVSTEVSLGAGELTIIVPDDMSVVIDTHIVAGEYTAPDGTHYSGTDLSWTYTQNPDGADGTLLIDASVGFGQLNVRLVERGDK
jgi:hypothetical protein